MSKEKIISLALLISISVLGYSQDFKVDASKSTLKWNAKKVNGEHYGSILLKEGSFVVKDDRIVNGNFVVDMETISCEDIKSEEWNKKLVDHLSSDDFFGVNSFKTSLLSNLKSTPFKDGRADATAELTIKGQTYPIKFAVYRDNNTYKTKITVDRTLYNIRYGSGKFFDNLGDNIISDEFTLDVAITVK